MRNCPNRDEGWYWSREVDGLKLKVLGILFWSGLWPDPPSRSAGGFCVHTRTRTVGECRILPVTLMLM